ncbi:ribosomal RNA large subunit methyltransferase I isoform X1 [Cucumis melo var. makuwa]|uniref:Ribosomal RNA large subunit methyltransferase I isoform X1 n=1 Tax=Cucumis melo var. makuwa TaxID=1194695 RepID=A0A5A7UHS0_CUCMM|nr:ribosomal RNA large subunit methyltransferase I isoform X1 [Cucumis melo var. makuwa]TYJ95592.1 ribosomal RNA large subunit methyltransferase I isoform X1 [Cucumis melo var. makuwa]
MNVDYPNSFMFVTLVFAERFSFWVVLKKGKAQLFKDGSPMVYSGAVDRIIGRPPPKTGDVVLVADGTEKPIGWGLYNSVSMFSVRLMQLEEEAASDPSCTLNVEKMIETRIHTARELRKNLGLPSASTNAYRLVNSEGDRLSGLIIDVFGDLAVVASSAAWVEKYKAEIEDCVRGIEEINHVKWRPSVDILKEEGIDVSELKETSPSTCPERTKVKENGIFYTISLEGQKTGFYADQRENRHFISTISEGQKVLDLCCYSGGFSLNALRGGAINVTGIDSSLPALELAKENVVLNSMDPERISFLKADATAFMKDALSRNESWDIVILDPPKLAPRKKVLQTASGMYRNLNSLAMQLTRKGGFLMTCSCSGAMTQSGMFLQILQGAASMAKKKITVLRPAGAACDHPIDPSYPEGAYLSNILLRVL